MAKPVRPEPKFFLSDSEFYKGSDFYLEKYFREVSDSTKVIGEKGTSYIEYGYVANRIHSFFDAAKILIILRNPVDRALSNYFFSVENGLETRSINEVFIQKAAAPALRVQTSVSPFNYLERGHYFELMKPYVNVFKENVKVVFFEEVMGNVDAIRSIYNFLDVHSDFIPPSIDRKINEAKYKLNGDDVTEVREVLHQYFNPHIKSLEDFLKRKIHLWYD